MRKKRDRLQFPKSPSKFPVIIFIVSLLVGGFFGLRIISTLRKEKKPTSEPLPVETQSLSPSITKTPELEVTVEVEPQGKVKAEAQETREEKPEVAKEKVEQKREIKVDKVTQEPSSEFYTIQVASFKDRKRAEILVSQLKEKNFSPIYIHTRGKWFEVWVGRFPTRKDSEKFLPRLQEDFHDAFMRKLASPYEEVSSEKS